MLKKNSRRAKNIENLGTAISIEIIEKHDSELEKKSKRKGKLSKKKISF